MVQLLLSHGGGVERDARNKEGRSALHLAAEHGESDVVRVLLARGAQRDAADDRGYTPLFYCTDFRGKWGDSAGCEGVLRDEFGAAAKRVPPQRVSKRQTFKVSEEEQRCVTFGKVLEVGEVGEAGEAAAGGGPVTAFAGEKEVAGAAMTGRALEKATELKCAERPPTTEASSVSSSGADGDHRGGAESGEVAAVTADAAPSSPATAPATARVTDAEMSPSERERLVRAARLSTGGGAQFLVDAAKSGRAAEVEAALEAGISVTVVDSVDGEGTGWPPLHCAAFAGHADIVRLLVSRGGANVDARDPSGRTALHCAALAGHVAVARLLIAHGASCDAGDNDGYTPLWLCLRSSEAEGDCAGVEQALREGGAVCTMTPNRQLLDASREGSVAAVEAALAAGADADCRDTSCASGHRALHWAAWFGHTKVVELLLARGCARDATNNDGQSALYYCTEYQYRQGDSAGCEAALRNLRNYTAPAAPSLRDEAKRPFSSQRRSMSTL